MGPTARRTSLTFALLLAALAPAACRRAGTPAAPFSLRIAHEADVLSLDPAAFRETATNSILSNVYEGLVAFDADMKLVPALADKWNTVDELTWVFELRRGVVFHDGTPLTAKEVKTALDRTRTDGASAVRGGLATIQDVDALGEYTLRMRTRRRDPLLLNTLSYVLLARDTGRPGDQRFVGTGPYRIVRWDKGKVLEAEAWPKHWNGVPAVGRVSFVPVEEGEGSVRALKDGRVDLLRFVPEMLAGEVRALSGVHVSSRLGLGSYYLWFNSEPARGGAKNPFADVRVRQAVSQSIDRQRIIQSLGGNGVPANQIVQQGVFGYIAGLPPLPHDPAAARQLLKEAGYPNGLEIHMQHRSGVAVTTVAELIRDMLAEGGIRVVLETPPWGDVVAGWQAGRLPFFLAGWRFENGDAISFLRDCVYTRDPARNLGGYNSGFSDPALDRMIDDNAEIFGETNRLKQYEGLMKRALSEMPLVPLYTRYNLFGVSDRVEWKPRLDGKLLAAEMTVRPPSGE